MLPKVKALAADSPASVSDSLGRQTVVVVLAAAVLLALVVVIAKLGLDAMNDATAQFQRSVDEHQAQAQLISQMIDAVRDRILIVHATSRQADPIARDEAFDRFLDAASRFLVAREALRERIKSTAQREQIMQQSRTLSEAQTVLLGVMERLRTVAALDLAGDELAAAILEAHERNDQVIDEMIAMRDLQDALANAVLAESKRRAADVQIVVVSLLVALFVVSGLLVTVLIRTMTRQNGRVASLAQALAEQNQALGVRVRERSADLVAVRHENLRMAAELGVAHRLQQMLLPSSGELEGVARYSGLRIVASMTPAAEAGGDYYDVLAGPDDVLVAIGDVTGHGLESGVAMLVVQSALRALALEHQRDPRRMIVGLNRVVHDNLGRMRLTKCLTLTVLRIRPGEIEIAGQHEEVLIVRSGVPGVERIDTLELGLPLGLEPDVEVLTRVQTVSFAEGDRVVLYTDGIVEAENEAGRFYGLDRLCSVLDRHRDASVEDLHQLVLDDVAVFVGSAKVFDDLTLIVLEQTSAAVDHGDVRSSLE